MVSEMEISMRILTEADGSFWDSAWDGLDQ